MCYAVCIRRASILTLFGLLAVLSGCQKQSAPAPGSLTTETRSPKTRLAELAKAYQEAKTYQDAGELRFLVDGAPEEEFRTIPFSVAFERPNRLRLHVMDTTSVADGERFLSMVQSLPGQVLSRACPETLGLANVYSDDMLAQTMRGQLGVDPPQLALLLEPGAIQEMTRDCTATQLADSEFQGRKCHRLALEGPEGKSVLWLDAESGLLVKYEFPLDEIRKRFPLARLWAEFRGAKLNDTIDPVAFKSELPEGIKLVSKLVMPPPPAPPAILGKPVGEYTFVGLDGSAVGHESLAGKIVVVDLWATWCGWCFEGLPLLEKVYQQYKDNDRVVFLAVSKDDLAVTNANVGEAFEKHKLNIPIVRDHKQITDQLFQLEGLPTTIVLGADGTVQDYHVGYDANLAETLPAKLEKLLAGENLAQAQLDEHERAKQEFEARLEEVARRDTTAR